MQHNQKYGYIGEEIAADYLIRSSYKIIYKNKRIKRDEIDIIATKNNSIIFIEVKTRLNNNFGSAEDQLSKTKYFSLKRAVSNYSHENHINEERLKIEFIAINLNISNKMANIKHFLNIL